MDDRAPKEKPLTLKRMPNQSLAAGHRHTVGLKSDGTVTAVGDNKYGQCDVSSWRILWRLRLVMYIGREIQVTLILLALNQTERVGCGLE